MAQGCCRLLWGPPEMGLGPAAPSPWSPTQRVSVALHPKEKAPAHRSRAALLSPGLLL